jgi:hypothetical protein
MAVGPEAIDLDVNGMRVLGLCDRDSSTNGADEVLVFGDGLTDFDRHVRHSTAGNRIRGKPGPEDTTVRSGFSRCHPEGEQSSRSRGQM